MVAVTSQFAGLSSIEVAQRLAQGQSNNYKITLGRTYWAIVRDNIFNLFNILLALLLAVMFIQHDYTNILLAGFAVVLNSLFGLVQEIKARRALDQLAALAITEVNVIRDGEAVAIPLTQVVKDDLLPVKPGDRIVVDGRLCDADSLEIDESQLTGESDKISKMPGETLWSGSFVTAGTGLMVATQVGRNSSVNKLASTAKTYRISLTPTQEKINKLVGVSALATFVLGPMLIGVGLLNHLPTLEIVRNAVVLVTSLIAQGLVLSTTLSFLLGAIRISQRQVLVQRINAIESLAHTNVLCFDKTGTLTRNQLSVRDLIPLNGQSAEAVQDLLRLYISNLAYLNNTVAAIRASLGSLDALQGAEVKRAEIPFNSTRKWGGIELADHMLLLGAAESLLHPAQDRELIDNVKRISSSGSRVLVFARCEVLPHQDNLNVAGKCEPLAMIVLTDQIRENIQTTLQSFYDQQVQLKVISGDNPDTVRAIAAEAGVRMTDLVFTGSQLESMSPVQFDAAVRTATVFARITPETKRHIIAALRRQGYYTAMVGDGVNDVPALKEANLAIAMNDGAQIARDVADVVLLNNALETLPLAFAEGKTITQKIYGTTRLFVAKNLCAVLLIVCTSLLLLPFPITPFQISWLTLAMVNIPAALITFGVLRPSYFRSFGRQVITYAITSALVGMVGGTLVYILMQALLGQGHDLPIDNAMALAFRDAARGGLFVFLALFCVLVFWNTHGVDAVKPATFRGHTRELIVGVLLLIVTIVPTMAFNTSFALISLLVPHLPLIFGIFLATAVGTSILLTRFAE